ncbi:uncharacterized protein DUF1194 [Palleronia aestuarii]|uniref:Uncharacterized protein DUF1194 n=1 Tax=Palleronia aestuarii TaxID=568105 RepID=A0A2W7ND69_9RHOB|nr:DUF1194 domain-containing protein [Palleronia aestuarii]PZX18325.1 uncharacterized protein DUF1194 [Palleronia aestuarii]
MRVPTCLAALLLGWGTAHAQLAEEVDVELLLLVDVSRSMTPNELEIQRRGYAEALAAPDVIDAMLGGFLGRVAISYAEWAGAGSQRIVIEWRILESAEDARSLSDDLGIAFNPSMRRTSISGALAWGARHIEENGIDGLRRVIDISGDGPNNEGRPVPGVRDAVISRGITINGLPLMTQEGMGQRWHLDDLDQYYADCVIGGPGAFMLPVYTWAEFGAAIRRKLVLELAGSLPERILPAQYREEETADCLAGERIWERNRRIYDFP